MLLSRVDAKNPHHNIQKGPLISSSNDFSHEIHDASREPSLDFPAYSHGVQRPYAAGRPMEASQFGYERVGEQTGYGGGGPGH